MKFVAWILLSSWVIAMGIVLIATNKDETAQPEVQQNAPHPIAGARLVGEVSRGSYTLYVYEFEGGVKCAWDVGRAVDCLK